MGTDATRLVARGLLSCWLVLTAGCPPTDDDDGSTPLPTQDDDDTTVDDDDSADDDDLVQNDDDSSDDDDSAEWPCPPIALCDPDCVLDIDPVPVQLAGNVSWNGAPIPTTNRWSLEFIDVHSGGTLTAHPRPDGSFASSYDVPMMPGKWDVYFNWNQAYTGPDTLDDLVLGSIPLASAFILSDQGGALDVLLEPVRVSGALQWDGANIPQGIWNEWFFFFVDPNTGDEFRVSRDAADGPVGSYDIPMMPGTYDVYFQWSSVDSTVPESWPDPVYGRTLIAPGLTIPSDGVDLDVELEPARVTGTVQWNGDDIPGSPDNVWRLSFTDPATGEEFYVDRDAALGDVSDYDIPMHPGTYEVAFAWISPSEDSLAWPDPVYGPRVVAPALTVTKNGATLDIDLETHQVVGALRWDDSPIPGSYGNEWQLVFTNSTTGEEHWVSEDASGGAKGSFHAPMYPGTWDISFRWISTSLAPNADPDPIWGDIPVAWSVPVPGPQVDVEPDPTRLTGALSWNSLPVPSSDYWIVWTMHFTDPATGASYSVERRNWGDQVGSYDVPVLPGTWDVAFSWEHVSGEVMDQLDPIWGSQEVASAVDVSPGGASLDVELAPRRLSGLLNWDDAPIPQGDPSDWWIHFEDRATGEASYVVRNAEDGDVSTYDVPVQAGVWRIGLMWGYSDTWPQPLYGVVPIEPCALIE
jgi:hypothetical protein